MARPDLSGMRPNNNYPSGFRYWSYTVYRVGFMSGGMHQDLSLRYSLVSVAQA
jgi:hypothetical protein